MMEAAAFTSAPKGREEFAAASGETGREGWRAIGSINWKLRRRRPRKSPFFGGLCAHASIFRLSWANRGAKRPSVLNQRGEKNNFAQYVISCTFSNVISIFFYCSSSVASKNALAESISLPPLRMFGKCMRGGGWFFFSKKTICRQVLKQCSEGEDETTTCQIQHAG